MGIILKIELLPELLAPTRRFIPFKGITFVSDMQCKFLTLIDFMVIIFRVQRYENISYVLLKEICPLFLTSKYSFSIR